MLGPIPHMPASLEVGSWLFDSSRPQGQSLSEIWFYPIIGEKKAESAEEVTTFKNLQQKTKEVGPSLVSPSFESKLRPSLEPAHPYKEWAYCKHLSDYHTPFIVQIIYKILIGIF